MTAPAFFFDPATFFFLATPFAPFFFFDAADVGLVILAAAPAFIDASRMAEASLPLISSVVFSSAKAAATLAS